MQTTHTQRSAVYLILQDPVTQQIVMILRQNTGYEDGHYGLPAGHIELGEAATEAMIREAHEEIGITLAAADLQPVHVQQRRTADYVYFDVYFWARRWQGQPRNCEPDKCGDVRWVALAALPENSVPFTRQIVQEFWPQGISYSQYGF